MAFVTATLDAAGTICIAFAALGVHRRVLSERKIDRHVFRVMKLEQGLGVFGILCIALSYIIKILA